MADPNDIREEFSPLLDDELTPDARDAVERELAQDSALLRELDALRRIDGLYRSLPKASAPSDLALRVREQISGKTNVTPMRRRRLPIALYSGLAAAAAFMVVIGGLVVRQEFVVSPSPADRAQTAASSELAAEAPDSNAETAPERGSADAVALGDAQAPMDEDSATLQDAPRDDRAAPVAVGQSVEVRRAQAESRPRQEAADSITAAGRPAEAKAKEETAPMAPPMTEAAPPPPPPPPAPAPDEASSAEGATEPEMAATAAEASAKLPASEMQASALRKRLIEPITIGDRVFESREDGWYQRGYDGERTRELRRGSDALNGLAPQLKGLDDMLALEGAVVFRLDEGWYRIPPEDAEQP